MNRIPIRKLPWLACIVPGCIVILTVQAADFNPIRAYWKEHEVHLPLQGFDFADYSCRSIERKLGDLLQAVGAREDAQIIVTGCLLPHTKPQETVIYASIRFHALLPPPEKNEPAEGNNEPEEKSAEDTITQERETAAELRRRSFPAERAQTQLAWQDSRPVERGDCILLQRFRDRVLPYIPHQVVDAPACDSEAPKGPRLRILVPARQGLF